MKKVLFAVIALLAVNFETLAQSAAINTNPQKEDRMIEGLVIENAPHISTDLLHPVGTIDHVVNMVAYDKTVNQGIDNILWCHGNTVPNSLDPTMIGSNKLTYPSAVLGKNGGGMWIIETFNTDNQGAYIAQIDISNNSLVSPIVMLGNNAQLSNTGSPSEFPDISINHTTDQVAMVWIENGNEVYFNTWDPNSTTYNAATAQLVTSMPGLVMYPQIVYGKDPSGTEYLTFAFIHKESGQPSYIEIWQKIGLASATPITSAVLFNNPFFMPSEENIPSLCGENDVLTGGQQQWVLSFTNRDPSGTSADHLQTIHSNGNILTLDDATGSYANTWSFTARNAWQGGDAVTVQRSDIPGVGSAIFAEMNPIMSGGTGYQDWKQVNKHASQLKTSLDVASDDMGYVVCWYNPEESAICFKNMDLNSTSYRKRNPTAMEVQEVLITPNPATNVVSITNLTESTIVTITEITGRIVLKQDDLTNGENLDISSISPGMYLMTF